MKTTKILTLAALAALSLGVGTAMAQDGGGGSFPDYQSTRLMTSHVTATNTVPSVPAANTVQSGSSDVDPALTGANHSGTFIWEHQLYGANGVAG